jgi:hypothetical protein
VRRVQGSFVQNQLRVRFAARAQRAVRSKVSMGDGDFAQCAAGALPVFDALATRPRGLTSAGIGLALASDDLNQFAIARPRQDFGVEKRAEFRDSDPVDRRT